MHELVLVEDFEPQERLPQEGVDAVDLQAVPALELLLQRRLAELGLDVQPLVLDPRLMTAVVVVVVVVVRLRHVNANERRPRQQTNKLACQKLNLPNGRTSGGWGLRGRVSVL